MLGFKTFKYLLFILGIGQVVSGSAQSALFAAPDRGFTSWLPAPTWDHALLSGNGTMGALVYGHPHTETIILSQAQLFLPQERSDELIDQASRLEEIRNLIRQGNYSDAAKIPVEIRNTQGYTARRDPFIPAFDIKITQEASNISKYLRSTDFETGEAKTTWTDDLGTFQRKLFVSRADSVIVLSIKSDTPINARIRFEHRPVEWNQWGYIGEHVGDMNSQAEGRWLIYRSNFRKKYKGSLEGYEGAGLLRIIGGSMKNDGTSIQIKEADEILLLVDIRPNYHYSQSLVPEIKANLSSISLNYEQLLERHVAIHGVLFNRMKLDLNSTTANRKLHSEELLLKAEQQHVPMALIEKTFDAGRYNILSSTGLNPPNLQGIWSGTWTAAWSSGFTHDGNLPSAMSVVMPGNMPELMKSYVNYLEKFQDDFEENAKKLFGARGVILPAHTTTSGFPTDFNETWCLSLWTGGAGWAADIIYDYYRYTGDRDFLKNHAYPWMKQASLFYEDFLRSDDKETVFNPSYSPENNPANSPSQAAINATMDVMITKQLLKNTIDAGKLLGEEPGQIKKWEDLLEKLPGYEVNPEGVLREWLWPGLQDNYRHRHVSQLYSLFNDMDPDITGNPVLRSGAVKLIQKKLEFRREEGGGEMAFGLVQLGLSAAHLGESEQAHEAVNWLASRYWSTGFASFHNVGGLLNTDISGGLPAVIIQMLVYSGEGSIYLLPALPDEWKQGSIEGALLRNQIKLNALSWKDKEVETEFISQIRQKVQIYLPAAISRLTGMKARIKGRTATVELPQNEVVRLKFILE